MVEAIRNSYPIELAKKTFGIDRYLEEQQEALRYSQKPGVLNRVNGIFSAVGQFLFPTAYRLYQRRREYDSFRGRNTDVGDAAKEGVVVDLGITNCLLIGGGLAVGAGTGRVELGVGTYLLGRVAVNAITHAGFDLFRAIEEFRPASDG